jgi:two-component system cell cycle sensor histidine kinase/response regulator CckA
VSEQRQSGPEARRYARVLVMDDEDTVRAVVCRMLERLGYDVDEAKNGESAIELFDRARQAGRPFAVVILDLTVREGLGGSATLAALRERDSEVRAIASTGHAPDSARVGTQAQGFAALLVKPYTFTELAAAVAAVADRS